MHYNLEEPHFLLCGLCSEVDVVYPLAEFPEVGGEGFPFAEIPDVGGKSYSAMVQKGSSAQNPASGQGTRSCLAFSTSGNHWLAHAAAMS